MRIPITIQKAALIALACVISVAAVEAPKPRASGPSVQFTPNIVDFGYVTPGHFKEITLTVTNTGSSDLVITGDAFFPAEPYWGTRNDECQGATVAPGGSCQVTLSFVPTDKFGTRVVKTDFLIFDNAHDGRQKVLCYGWDETAQ